MLSWQQFIILFWLIYSFLGFLKGLQQSAFNKNPYGLSYAFNLIGAFVWGDAVIFGLFWTIVSLVTLFLDNWLLFLMAISFFWVIRSLGEMIYWLNEQFSQKNLNPPEKLYWSKIFPNKSVWFAYQIFWQCLLVVFLLFSCYFLKLWWNS